VLIFRLTAQVSSSRKTGFGGHTGGRLFGSVHGRKFSLSAGTHTLAVSVAAKGVQFYGFKVCQSFSEETSVSEASYTLSPKKFKDINGVMVGPREGFKLTFEMLRRKADSALIWYEDFRDRIILLKVTGLFFPENGRSGKRTTLRKTVLFTA